MPPQAFPTRRHADRSPRLQSRAGEFSLNATASGRTPYAEIEPSLARTAGRQVTDANMGPEWRRIRERK